MKSRNMYTHRKAIGGHYHAGTKHYTGTKFQLAKLTDVCQILHIVFLGKKFRLRG